MSDNQESLLLPELLAPPTTILVSMGWAMLDYVRYNIARAIPRFLRLQTAFVYPDGDQVKERIWVKVPVMRVKHGTSRGKKIINIDREDGALASARGFCSDLMSDVVLTALILHICFMSSYLNVTRIANCLKYKMLYSYLR
ncbi:hypothetical protein C8J57DRAFT_1213434 [Mycena rebaudengoi]|nr:hypothetical protein C8J57DRAFT_1213434 [Mycena rebaudengoi]